MKKAWLLITPLMAISLLASCGSTPKLPDYAIKMSIELKEEQEVSFICSNEDTFAINWGDGTINSETSHIYQAGLYNIQIDKQLKSFAIDIDKSKSEAIEYVKEVEVGNVLSLGSAAFWTCLNLKSVIFDENTPLVDIGEHAFAGCESLTSISIPKNITSINDTTFDGCVSLTSIDLPSEVTTIGTGAFLGCESLTSIDLPNKLTTIDSNAFYGCESLTSIELPNGLTTIDSNAFSGCTNLTSISIPDSIEYLGNSAFDECPLNFNSKGNIDYLGNNNHPYIIAVKPIEDESSYNFDENCKIICDAFSNISALTSIEIGRKVILINSGAFLNCPNLSSIVIDSNNEKYESGNYNAIIEKSSNTLMLGCKNTVIPNNVVTIGDNAFSNCVGLSSISIPGNVIKIGSGTFSGCESLISIELPNGLTTIGNSAFYGCTSLSSISIPDSIEYLGKDVFNECPLNYNSEGNINYLGNDNHPYLVAIKTTENNDTFTINNSCRVIYYNAFNYSGGFFSAPKLSNIEIPKEVITIGNNAFGSCSKLSSVIFEDDSCLKTIDSFAFCSCIFNRISIPSKVTLIGEFAFMACTNLNIFDLTQLSVPPKADRPFDTKFFNGRIYVTSKTIQAFKSANFWSKFADKITDDPVPAI